MSSIAEERSASRRPRLADGWSLERLLAWRPRITAEVVAYGVIIAVAVALRFWDLGARAIHHDESLHATYSWYLYTGKGYEHQPLMHGPMLFHLMALGYLLFGVSDATARFVPAFFGAVLVLLPLLLRPWLGRAGSLAAAVLIALSPTLLYFSRFVGAGAQDIIVSVGMLMIVAGIWHYLRSGGSRWIYLVTVGLAVGFTTKEVTYMLAAILALYLNGAVAAGFAAQHLAARRRLSRVSTEPGHQREGVADDIGDELPENFGYTEAEDSPIPAGATAAGRWLTVLYMPIAWALVLFWPWIAGVRQRMKLTSLPRAAGPLVIIGTFSAPFFAAASQVALKKVGVYMEAASPFRDWSNEKFWGALTIGTLMALSAYFGMGWRRKEWLIAAGIFWGASFLLFTTFLTNPDGVATGIWGSLDYWLAQQGERRGMQPVFYYLIITPVYEYLALTLALAIVAWRAVRTGRDTAVAAALAIVAIVAGAVLGDGARLSLPFIVVALVAATYAMRAHPFQQFLVFWFGAILLGLSVAGEKMPWLEVHLALPLALLAGLAINDAWEAARTAPLPAWIRPVGAFALVGGLAAALALASDRYDWANPVLALVVAGAVIAVAAVSVRRLPGAALAAVAFVAAFAGPLTVRGAFVAAYENGDVPREMLVYTQSSPALARINRLIDQYARESGQGKDLTIVVDSAQAFAWPWVWYLRDYKKATYPDLESYRNNPSLIATLPPNSVLLTELGNASVGTQRSDIYGPGIRYEHRWWFPEGFDPRPGYAGEGYRGVTTSNLWKWIRDPSKWKAWGTYFLHRDPGEKLGSVDAVAYFPVGWNGATAAPIAAPAVEPRLEADGRLVTGEVGSGKGQFQRPAGLAADAFGNIYVADSLNNRVQQIGPDGKVVAVLSSPQGFREPWGVAVAPDGSVYVADTWNHRIQKFDAQLKFVRMWGGPAADPNASTFGPLELYGPRSIAVDAAGNLWVTDTGHHRVVKYGPDGQPLATFGRPGSGPGEFQEPVAIAIAPGGDLYVTDAWNGRVQRFDPSFAYKSEFRVDGWTDRGPESKPYLATAPDGSVYVAVPNAGAVLRFGANGSSQGVAATLEGGAGRATALGVAVDSSGQVWVSDGANGKVSRLPGR